MNGPCDGFLRHEGEVEGGVEEDAGPEDDHHGGPKHHHGVHGGLP